MNYYLDRTRRQVNKGITTLVLLCEEISEDKNMLVPPSVIIKMHQALMAFEDAAIALLEWEILENAEKKGGENL